MIRIISLLRMILFIMILPTFAFFGSGDTLLDKLQKDGYIGTKVNLEYLKQVLLVTSVLFPSVFLTFRNEWLIKRNKTVQSQRSLLLNQIRTGTLAYFQKQINSPDMRSTRIRLFIRKRKYKWTKWWKIEKEFCLVKKHIDGLCTPDSANGLVFNIRPDLQGVVAECYHRKQIMYEDAASTILNSYNLDSYQKVAYTGILFWLCSPIINNKGEVVAVLSLESIDYIDITDPTINGETDVIMTSFCKDLYDNCPELFK